MSPPFVLFGEMLLMGLIHSWQEHEEKEQGLTLEPHDSLLRLNDLEVGQWTGLKDINGKEIYEGDLLVFDDDHDEDKLNPITVHWNSKFCSIAMKRKGWMFDHFFGEAGDAMDCIIIGNKYENPELLKP